MLVDVGEQRLGVLLIGRESFSYWLCDSISTNSSFFSDVFSREWKLCRRGIGGLSNSSLVFAVAVLLVVAVDDDDDVAFDERSKLSLLEKKVNVWQHSSIIRESIDSSDWTLR